MMTGPEHDEGPTYTAGLVQQFEDVYCQVRKLLAETLSRATSHGEQALWRRRSERLRRFRDLVDRADVFALFEAISVLGFQQRQVGEHIAQQIGGTHV